ncbi:MAG: NUDIX domain-containing protein [Armatimonadota bacterium]|nr:NUDIX domain-containing protein [Armatimonadota bacterium]
MTPIRSGVIIIEGNKVALIERVNAKGTYYLFPGGGVEAGETVEAAAIREAWEELGVEVQLAGLMAVVTFDQTEQFYYAAQIVGGEFGSGKGEELASVAASPAGTYRPVWLERNQLSRYNVRPKELAERVMEHDFKGTYTPFQITEQVG